MASIASLIELRGKPGEDCEPVDALVQAQLEEVRKKIELLRQLETELERITRGCQSGQIDRCYVIESLARHELCQQEHQSV